MYAVLVRRSSLFASANLFLSNLIVLLDADAQSSVCCWSMLLVGAEAASLKEMFLITDLDLSDTVIRCTQSKLRLRPLMPTLNAP